MRVCSFQWEHSYSTIQRQHYHKCMRLTGQTAECCKRPNALSGELFNIKTLFLSIRIPIIKIRRSWDCLIFIMAIPSQVRQHGALKPIFLTRIYWTIIEFKAWIDNYITYNCGLKSIIHVPTSKTAAIIIVEIWTWMSNYIRQVPWV